MSFERIAELKRLNVAQAEAYVRSVGLQIGVPDTVRVAHAIAELLGAGRSFKAKDVARFLEGGIVVPAPAPAGVDEEELPRRALAPDTETRRDTRYRFEQWANNPHCEANLLSAVHGVPMKDVALAEGLTPTFGQSPFALARGQMFEARLFKNAAALLIPELARHDVLPGAEATFRDFRLRLNGGTSRTLDEARAATGRLLREVADGSHVGSIVIAGATIRIPGGGMLPEAILVVDVLVVRCDLQPVVLQVGEVKTYPDRGGYTDRKELAVARAQAGVYVQGLRLVLEELGLQHRIEVSRKGFLVLSRPGYNAPSVRSGEELAFQAVRADRGFARLRAAAASLPPPVDDLIGAIRNAATTYDEGCLSFCDLAARCWQRAKELGDPAILGPDVARWLGRVGLHRTLELMDGAEPATPAERDLVQRMQGAQLPEVPR